MGRLSRFLRKTKSKTSTPNQKTPIQKTDVELKNLNMNKLKRVLQSSSTYTMVAKECDNVRNLYTGSKSTNYLEIEVKEPLLSPAEETDFDEPDEVSVEEEEEEEFEVEEEEEIMQIELQNVELFENSYSDSVDDSTTLPASDLAQTTKYVSLSPLICFESVPSHQPNSIKEQNDTSVKKSKKKNKDLKEKFGCFSDFFRLMSCTMRLTKN